MYSFSANTNIATTWWTKGKKSQYFCRQDAHTFYLVFKSPWKLFFPTLLLQLKTVFCSYMRAVSILYLPVSLWWVWSGCWIKKNIWALQNQTSRCEFTLVYQKHKTCPVFYANLKLGLFVARKGKSMRSARVFFCLSSPCSNIFQVTDLVELLMIMIINSSANQSFFLIKAKCGTASVWSQSWQIYTEFNCVKDVFIFK